MVFQLQAYAAQHGLRFAYPIMTNIYGPDDRFDPIHGHVVPSLVANFHAAKRIGGPVRVWGTGRAQRDFLYGEDPARALVRVAEDPVNVATCKTVRIADVVKLLARHSGVDNVQWDATKPDGQPERSYDVSRLAATGFEADTDIATGLARTYDWYAAAYPHVRS